MAQSYECVMPAFHQYDVLCDCHKCNTAGTRSLTAASERPDLHKDGLGSAGVGKAA